ncbi:MAG: YwaF family protein [Clostridia bacterium]|nr:YwaF family protein [Clostridia bacterium]
MLFRSGENCPGVFGAAHFIYLGASVVFGFLLIFLLYKFVKDEDKKRLTIRIIGIVHLLMILINRFSVTYYKVVIAKAAGESWLNLLPYTFCGLASLILSLDAIFGKKDNCILHFVCYFGLFGGIATLLYPDFLENQEFWDIRSYSGLFHHNILIYQIIIMYLFGFFKPSLKKWHFYPIGFIIMMFIGLLELEMLHFNEAMNIGKPLVSSLPVLTSWYTIFFASCLATFLIALLFNISSKKKTDI